MSPIWVTWPTVAKILGSTGVLIAVLMLADTRGKLQENNLIDTETAVDTTVTCDQRSLKARTADGSCNSLTQPDMGMVGKRFGRNVPLANSFAEDDAQLLTPNPREISRELFTRDEFKAIPGANYLATSWIQFMIHDWVSHGETDRSNPIEVPIAADDPWGSDTMYVTRSRKDTTRTAADAGTPASYQNVNTHWWDGSQVYGSDLATANSLRTFEGGRLIVTTDNRLPLADNGLPKVGRSENWWLGLQMLHQLFVLEHNAIADHLAANYPAMSDEELYDKARLVNAALMAKIHTVEWTTTILNNPVLDKAMNSNWYGLLGDATQEKTQKALRNLIKNLGYVDWLVKITTGKDSKLKDSIGGGSAEHAISGIVGASKVSYNDVPFAFTEEFVSIYRMHTLLRDDLAIKSKDSKETLATITLANSRNEDAVAIMREYDVADIWYSFASQESGALTLNNYPAVLQNLSIPLIGNIDLGAIDIIRDRERGVPRYNEFRRLVGLNAIRKFEDLSPDAALVAKMKRLYNNDIEQIDLLVGSLAETVRPEGFIFGETTFQLFILMASRRLMADRFYTEDFTEETYSPEGLNWVQSNDFTDIILRHFPEVGEHLQAGDNAFLLW